MPFTKAEKLDTQKGIKNNRNVGQKPNLILPVPEAVVLINKAIPMMQLNPNEVSQSRTLGSKYRTSTTRYQTK